MLIISASCSQQPKIDAKDYDKFPVYSGNDLGITYSSESSKFRIWAPTAEKAKILLYNEGLGGTPIMEKDMKKDAEGTWLLQIDGDLAGKFYTFRIKTGGKWLNETPGIYANAVGVNGMRAAVVNMSETNPDDWENDSKPALANFGEIVIYELHIRDLSISPTSGITNKGKFLGLTETGTVSQQGEKTGIDHLEELGITHLHILPAFDFKSLDETRLDENKYNWGYDPQNYNVPEGSFSTDPYNPENRIREFKQMVLALHQKGIRVIMDVVYNHTSDTENSNFSLEVPGYYYRHNTDGTLSNASACGNETASERPMMRKYMIESLKHWMTEYHVDGFRFDLMGIHDITTMNQIREVIHQIDPTIFLYGEGWTAGSSPLPQNEQAVKKFTVRLNGIAAFSDDIRDGIKGSWSDHKAKGFVSGAPGMEESIKFGVVASTQHPQVDYSKVNYSKEPWAKEPFQTINYASCHDNHTLWDKLNFTNPDDSEADHIKMDKLANTIVMTAQGVPFIHAAEDFLRTKQGVENSFNSPDSINQIDWERKSWYRGVFDYYQGLIKLRKAHPAFRMTTADDIRKTLEFVETGIPGVIAFILKNNANGDKWKQILVVYNASKKDEIVKFPFAKWTIVLNENGYNEAGHRVFKHNQLSVPAISAVVLAEVLPE
jgi:pullulanase